MTYEMRTDRNNNPIAVAVRDNGQNMFTLALDLAKIQWEYGDRFTPHSNMRTIKFKTIQDGQEGARVILSKTNAIQWYIRHTGKKILQKYNCYSKNAFSVLSLIDQNIIINDIYKHEGGNGKLKLFMKRELLRNKKTGEFAFQKNEVGEKEIITPKNAMNALLTIVSRAIGCRDIDNNRWKSIKNTTKYF